MKAYSGMSGAGQSSSFTKLPIYSVFEIFIIFYFGLTSCLIFAFMSDTSANKVVPFKESKLSKKEQVANMFDHIAYRYDFLNHFMSLNIDKIWRRKALHYLDELKPKSLLDVAAGTADFSIQASKLLSPEKIVGIDISTQMLEVGERKVKEADLEHQISLQVAD